MRLITLTFLLVLFMVPAQAGWEAGLKEVSIDEMGFSLMLLSMIIALYVSHRRVWLVLSPRSSGTRILMAGNTSKHTLAFKREFDRLVQEITELDRKGKVDE